MDREKIDTFKYVREMNEQLRNGGLFLVTGSINDNRQDFKPNVMTIGWGFLGTMWSKPVFIVAVRHSRHTHKLIEGAKSWTVCIPAKGMDAALEFCGTKSGSDVAKFKEMKFTAKKGITMDAPYIEECPIHIECTTIFKTEMNPGQLEASIEKEMYKTKNYHTIYFGEVKGVYAVKDAAKKLS